MSAAHPLSVFNLDDEMYKEQVLGVIRLIWLAKGFMVLVREGKCHIAQLKAFIYMLLRHPKSGKVRKILEGELPELSIGREEYFPCRSWQHRFFVECMRLDIDDPLPIDNILMMDDEPVKPISPAGTTLYEEINAQLWQVLYREATREKEENKATKGKGKVADMGKEAAKQDFLKNEEEWGEEAMTRMKDLAISLLNEGDMAPEIGEIGKKAWDQAWKGKTDEERGEEVVMNKLEQLTSPLRKNGIEIGKEATKRHNIEKENYGFTSRVKKSGSSFDMKDEEEVEDGLIDAMEIEEDAQKTKGKKGKKKTNKRKRR